MKKKQELANEELLIEVFAISYQFILDSTKNFIRIYEDKYKMLQCEIMKYEENEPLKIFKRTHKNWEYKKEQLNMELEDTFNNLLSEYIDFGNLIKYK